VFNARADVVLKANAPAVLEHLVGLISNPEYQEKVVLCLYAWTRSGNNSSSNTQVIYQWTCWHNLIALFSPLYFLY
jgi:hypothetical protein